MENQTVVFQTLTLFLCLAAALPAGCTRREDSASPPPEETRQERAAAAPRTSSQNQNQRRRPESPPAERPAIRTYTNRDDPFFGLPSSTSFPLDFTLGPLYNEAAADARSKEVFALIRDFFAALNAGRDAENYLHPDYRSFLARSLHNSIVSGGEWQPPEPPAAAEPEPETSQENLSGEKTSEAARAGGDEKPEKPEKPPASPGRLKSAIGSFRVGEIRFSGDRLTAEADVLITKSSPPKGRARGSLIAEEKNGRWYIAGLNIDFDSLFIPPAEKSGEIFDPGPSAGPLF